MIKQNFQNLHITKRRQRSSRGFFSSPRLGGSVGAVVCARLIWAMIATLGQIVFGGKWKNGGLPQPQSIASSSKPCRADDGSGHPSVCEGTLPYQWDPLVRQASPTSVSSLLEPDSAEL